MEREITASADGSGETETITMCASCGATEDTADLLTLHTEPERDEDGGPPEDWHSYKKQDRMVMIYGGYSVVGMIVTEDDVADTEDLSPGVYLPKTDVDELLDLAYDWTLDTEAVTTCKNCLFEHYNEDAIQNVPE